MPIVDVERLRMLIEDAKAIDAEADAEVTVESLSAAHRRAESSAALSRKKKEKWSLRLLRWMKRTLWDSWTCPRWFQLFQRCVAFFICDPFTDLFITICIVLNTACLAADHHGPTATETFRAVLKNANTVYVNSVLYVYSTVLTILIMRTVYCSQLYVHSEHLFTLQTLYGTVTE